MRTLGEPGCTQGLHGIASISRLDAFLGLFHRVARVVAGYMQTGV